MLSLSAELSHTDIDLQIINGQENAGDGGVQYGRELMKFAEALARRDENSLAGARAELRAAAGNEVLVDAAAVAGNFQRMVRIADSTGIPVDTVMGALSNDIQDKLDLRRFGSADNTPQLTPLQKLLNIPKRFLFRRVLSANDRKANSP
jgi:hypothetical protein